MNQAIDGRHCGVRAAYKGMAQVAPGHDVYQVAFQCACGHQWGEQMSYARAMVAREEQKTASPVPAPVHEAYEDVTFAQLIKRAKPKRKRR